MLDAKDFATRPKGEDRIFSVPATLSVLPEAVNCCVRTKPLQIVLAIGGISLKQIGSDALRAMEPSRLHLMAKCRADYINQVI